MGWQRTLADSLSAPDPGLGRPQVSQVSQLPAWSSSRCSSLPPDEAGIFPLHAERLPWSPFHE